MITSVCALALSLAPQGLPLTAAVNDSNSPGAVGDAHLSLDEAIRLANGDLDVGQLSPDEQAQVSGTGAMVNEIHLDATVTSVIELTAELPPVVGQGVPIAIESVSSDKPVLSAPVSLGMILDLQTPLVRVSGLILQGAEVGVRAEHSQGSRIARAELSDLELRGQAATGFLFVAGGQPRGQTTAVLVNRVRLHDMPIGYRLDDTSQDGGLLIESEYVEFSNVSLAVDVFCSAQDGTSVMELYRTISTGSETFLSVRRDPMSSQDLILTMLHGNHVVNGSVAEIQGSEHGLTTFNHHHSLLQAGESGSALRVGPKTARFDLHGSENTFVGNISIAASPFSPQIYQRNNHYRDGNLVIDNAGGTPALDWNRFSNVAFVVDADNETPVTISTSEFHGGSILGDSMTVPLTLDNCYLAGTTLLGNVQEDNPAPRPWIGLTTVSDPRPKIGESLSLETELPMGIGAVWHVGLSLSRPVVTDFPYVFYSDLNTLIALPAILIERNVMHLQIPNTTELVGIEFHAQAATFPFLGQNYVPPVHLPIGSLILLEM